jgi:hypothetical protein
MGLTAAGLALLGFTLLVIFSPGSRIRLVVAGILAVSIPVFTSMSTGLATLGASVAPVFNSLSGIGG